MINYPSLPRLYSSYLASPPALPCSNFKSKNPSSVTSQDFEAIVFSIFPITWWEKKLQLSSAMFMKGFELTFSSSSICMGISTTEGGDLINTVEEEEAVAAVFSCWSELSPFLFRKTLQRTHSSCQLYTYTSSKIISSCLIIFMDKKDDSN